VFFQSDHLNFGVMTMTDYKKPFDQSSTSTSSSKPFAQDKNAAKDPSKQQKEYKQEGTAQTKTPGQQTGFQGGNKEKTGFQSGSKEKTSQTGNKPKGW
jgi:hypothetical protein